MTSSSKKLSVLCDSTTYTARSIHQTAEDLERLAKSPSTPPSLQLDIRHHADRLFSIASRLMAEADSASPDHVIIRMLTEVAKYALVATSTLVASAATGTVEGYFAATVETTIKQTDELTEACRAIDQPLEQLRPETNDQRTRNNEEEGEEAVDITEPEGRTAEDIELPTAELLRRQLRIALVNARKDADMTQKTVASKLDWSASKMVRIEQGMVSVSPSDVRALLSLYGADNARIDELVQLAHSARQAKSWSEYDDIIGPAMKEMIGQEHAASVIFDYEPSIVPSLFQTADYTIELLQSSGLSAEESYRWAEVHSARRGILEMKQRPQLHVVLGETPLIRPVGSSQVMREQIRHLVTLSRKPGIEITLLPFTVGTHAAMDNQFIIHQFSDIDLDDSLYLEDGHKRTSSTEDSESIDQYLRYFSILEEKAESSGSFQMHAERILREHYPAR